MINRWQFCEHIIKPTLQYMNLYSLDAEKLLLHTAYIESRLTFLKQVGGPALGVYQIEPATHDDIFKNYINFRTELRDMMREIETRDFPSGHQALIGNLYYATAIARIHYLRVPHPLPKWDDIIAQAEYWKTFYNTPLGRGTVEKFVSEINALYPEGIKNDI